MRILNCKFGFHVAFVWSCLIVLGSTVEQVAHAYTMQLARPRVAPQPLQAFIITSGDLQVSLIAQGPTNPHPLNREQTLLCDVIDAGATNRDKLLWSMYPASVRGRAFGAQGGDPLATGGW